MMLYNISNSLVGIAENRQKNGQKPPKSGQNTADRSTYLNQTF
jgi:hypothetical protein